MGFDSVNMDYDPSPSSTSSTTPTASATATTPSKSATTAPSNSPLPRSRQRTYSAPHGRSLTSMPPTATSSSSPTNTAQTGSSGQLSTGAAAGIGAGVSTVALLGIAAAVFWFGRRKGKTSAVGNENDFASLGSSDGKPQTRAHLSVLIQSRAHCCSSRESHHEHGTRPVGAASICSI